MSCSEKFGGIDQHSLPVNVVSSFPLLRGADSAMPFRGLAMFYIHKTDLNL